MSFNREHPCFEQVSGRPLQQSGVTSFSQDSLVDLTSPLFFDDVGFNQIVADPHAESADGGVLRQGEMKHPFQSRRRVIHKRFFNRCSSNLVTDLDRDFVITYGQRFVTTIREFDDQRTE